MLNIFVTSLVPWIGFVSALTFAPHIWILPIWAFFLIYMVYFAWPYLRRLYPMSLANLFLFVMLFVNGYFGWSQWILHHGAVICYTTFALTGALTMIAGTPFTNAYARQNVPRDKWDHPIFKRINMVVSGAWVLAFVTNALICEFTVSSELGGRVICISVLIAAIMFSTRYPVYARNALRTVTG